MRARFKVRSTRVPLLRESPRPPQRHWPRCRRGDFNKALRQPIQG